jgi:hypothetical protein
MSQEFDCIECGRHIVRITALRDMLPKLCGHCLTMPGWFRNPELHEKFAPEGLDNLPDHEMGG